MLPAKFASNKKYSAIIFFLMYAINFFALLLNIIDIEYYKYTHQRSTADLFNIIFSSNDVLPLLPAFITDFWYVGIIWILICALIIYLSQIKKINLITFFSQTTHEYLIWSILIIIILFYFVFSVRGFGLKPIRRNSTLNYTKLENTALISNTPFSIITTLFSEKQSKKIFMPDSVAKKFFNPNCIHQPTKKLKLYNIIILIIESLSQQYIGALNNGKGYTPFLDSLIHSSLVFKNAFATQTNSKEALPAILGSFPPFIKNSFTNAFYSVNKFEALPYILKKHGYVTAFFHGAKNGSMGFDLYCKSAGIDYYFGKNEYTGPEAYDGNWGIRDEEFLLFSLNTMNHFKQPFFSCIFTLSSHHPFTIPQKYKNIFHELGNPIYKTIRYTDYVLKQFFYTAQKHEWFSNSLFILCADHAFQNDKQSGNLITSNYKIPIILFSPSDTTFRGTCTIPVSQLDILPTVVSLLNHPQKYFSFGKNLLDTLTPHPIFFMNNEMYCMLYNNYLVMMEQENNSPTYIYNYIIDESCSTNLYYKNDSTSIYLESLLKSALQQFTNNLNNNTFYYSDN